MKARMKARTKAIALLAILPVAFLVWLAMPDAEVHPEPSAPLAVPTAIEMTPQKPQLLPPAGLPAQPPAQEPAAPRVWLRIIDEAGAVVPDAAVHSVPPKASHVVREGRWTGSSDAEGRLALPVSVPGEGEVLLVRHPLFVPQVVIRSQLEDAGPGDVTVVLRGGQRIAGRVEDPWGKPVPGARVVVRLPQGAAPEQVLEQLPGPTLAARYRVVTADERGRFAVAGLTSFPLTVAARKRYYLCFPRPDYNLKEPREDIVLVLHPQARLGVRAFDAVTRLPIAQFHADAATEAHGRAYRRSALEMPRADVPPTGLARSGKAFWLTFALIQRSPPSPSQTIPILVNAWGYRRTTVELSPRYPDDADFSEAQDVFLEPMPAREKTGQAVFDVSFPALGRKPDRAWIALVSVGLDIPAARGRMRDPRLKPNSPLSLWLKEGRASIELPAGSYEVRLDGGPPVPHPMDWSTFTVREDETTEVELSIPGSVIRVRAFDPQGDPVPYFAVSGHWKGSNSLYRSHFLVQRGETLEQEVLMYGIKPGELAFPMVPTPQMGFLVMAPGFKPWSKMHAVEGGKQLVIEAHLVPEDAPPK